MKSANKVKMRTSIIVLFFIIVAAFCKYAYLLSDVMLFDKFAVFVRVYIYISDCFVHGLFRLISAFFTVRFAKHLLR